MTSTITRTDYDCPPWCERTDHHPFTAIDAAEAQALADHRAGTCHLSEFSCSHCEVSA